VQTHTWHLTKGLLSPDGVERELILVNGNFPGPNLFARTGEQLEITVVNDLDEPTTIHWHGLHQRGSNIMDGVEGVTQCGIPVGQNFTYKLNLDRSGTFWWHSHSKTHRAEGLYGALIVEDPRHDKYKAGEAYDEDLVVVLTDHYHKPTKEVLQDYVKLLTGSYEPVPDNGLINGLNEFDCQRLHRSSALTCHPGVGKLSQFVLDPTKTYRLRIINASAYADFEFSIDDHELLIIEADSTEVELVPVHYVPIASGQRYSAILTKKTAATAVYMRAKMNEECFNYPNLQLDPEVKAIITYQKSDWLESAKDLLRRKVVKTAIPTTKPWADVIPPNSCRNLDEHLLIPVISQQVPPADVQVIVWPRIMKLMRTEQLPYAYFNRTSWRPAVGAPNLQVALGLVNVSDTPYVSTISKRPDPKWGGDQLVKEVPLGSVVELIINNNDEDSHPFHLHGHDFWILHNYEAKHGGLGEWNVDYINDYRLDNPIRRDTFTVPQRGHAVIRWVADNPGIWSFHCHIIWHLATGMMMQFSEGMETFTEEIPDEMIAQVSGERKDQKKK
jgi:FtsP/CotA-like multicopper oxidase with cupredoxin domain